MRRLPPYSLAAEAALLGAVLLRNKVLSEILDLEPEALYHPGHRAVFKAMLAAATAGQPIDAVTLERQLEKDGKLHAIGGVSFLAKIVDATPGADNARDWADIVREKHLARQLLLAGSDIVERAYGDYGDIDDFVGYSVQRLREASAGAGSCEPRSAAALVKAVFKQLDERLTAGGVVGVPTGFRDLEERLGGLQRSHLHILAARPAMGKTALAGAIAHHAAEQSHPTLFFSLEMQDTEIIERDLCASAKVEGQRLRRGQLNREELGALTAQAARYQNLPYVLDDQPALPISTIRARSLRFASQHEGVTGLIVVDYLQLVRGSKDSRKHGREQEISEVSAGLKALAKELAWPVLAVAQLNRAVESRGGDKRPRMSDLRESGAIEQDADVIMFLYRDEVYHPDTNDRGVAEVIIAKNRHGPAGTEKLLFDGRYTRFDELTWRDSYE